jgi:hypothetical protein
MISPEECGGHMRQAWSCGCADTYYAIDATWFLFEHRLCSYAKRLYQNGRTKEMLNIHRTQRELTLEIG